MIRSQLCLTALACLLLICGQPAHGAAPMDNDDANKPTCVLTIPDDPLSAASLSTPWMVTGCKQTDPEQTTFVEAVVYDTAGRALWAYAPLVLDPATQAGAAPTPLTLPPNAVVAVWISSNAKLELNGTSTALGQCVQGLGPSRFGAFAYCNAPALFAAAKVTLPELGKAADGGPCITTRDFVMTDKDQSDNVYVTYLVDSAARRIAQNTAANRQAMPNAKVVVNGDDTAFLQAMFQTMKCAQFQARSLTESGQMVPALALDEIQAAMLAQAPIALIPDNNPNVMVNGEPSAQKRNLYREGVGQATDASGDPTAYCRNYANSALRIAQMKSLASTAPSPDPDVADSLYTFQCRKFISSYTTMKCQDRLGGMASPVTVTNTNSIATGCQIDTTSLSVTTTSGGGGGSTPATKSSGSVLSASLLGLVSAAIWFAVAA